jgi:hypothetical protein
MRATISFETDLEQVEGTMAVLACSEEHNLRAAADILSNYTVLDGNVLDAVTEVLRLLDESATQLRQYQHMIVSFEKSKFETIVPQAATQSMGDVAATLANIDKFGSFIDRLNESAKEGEPDATPSTSEG